MTIARERWPDKDPDERLDYLVDLREWVATGRTIDSAEAVVESADPTEAPFTLVVDAVTFNLDVVAVWMSGGTAGLRYTVKVTATDDNAAPSDRQVVRRGDLRVRAQ